jgi:hypothetical protein
MRELNGYDTFLVGLQVDEDGDLRFAISGSILEIRVVAGEPLALREVHIAETEESGLAPWQTSCGPE